MNPVISKEQILENLCKQIDSLFSISSEERDLLATYMDKALAKCEVCFANTNNKYFKVNGVLGGGKI